MSIITVKECVLLILFILISGAEGNPHHYTPKGGSSAAPPLATHFACQSDPCLHGLCIDHSANRYIACECVFFYDYITLALTLMKTFPPMQFYCFLCCDFLFFDGLVYYVFHHQHVLVLLRGGLYGIPVSNGLERVLV